MLFVKEVAKKVITTTERIKRKGQLRSKLSIDELEERDFDETFKRFKENYEEKIQ